VRAPTRRPTRGPLRRIERWGVGVAMSMVALVLERIVMRSVRSEGRTPTKSQPNPTTFRSKGGAVDLDE
jgi:hypothetical protein